MPKIYAFFFFSFLCSCGFSQQWNSAGIYQEIKKLQVNGSVLYIAAHPDDENTRLLAYLANERLYRTGYLSLTRGDGGQNLIGEEQGVDLGLIRTQELLAARKIDGAQQFFSSAYDFGFSKTSAETFTIWDKEKVLGDVVWVIRKFKPDVLIARFPEDSRAGHGHHAASAIIAREAFFAAADKTRFPEQFAFGVGTWQAKRLVWNTFNFGGTNTTSENQIKIDVGGYNSLLGKSYGEIAAESRSQHKSQGFGVPAQRGSQVEYFTLIAGDSMKSDMMDDVQTNLFKTGISLDKSNFTDDPELETIIQNLTLNYSFSDPSASVPQLLKLYKTLNSKKDRGKLDRLTSSVKNIIINCIGLYAEASTNTAYGVQGDSLKINFSVNARLENGIHLQNIFYKTNQFNCNGLLEKNKNLNFSRTILLAADEKLTQPYWLINPMGKGNFEVKDQLKVGNADGDYETAQFVFEIEGNLLIIDKPIQYKYTDPVKGEKFEPLFIIPAIDMDIKPTVIVQTNKKNNNYTVQLTPKKNFGVHDYLIMADSKLCDTVYTDYILKDSLTKNRKMAFVISKHPFQSPPCLNKLEYSLVNASEKLNAKMHLKTIHYDHIPAIAYLQKSTVNFINSDIKSGKKRVGYIVGAGDKVPAAIEQLGYSMDFLTQKDMQPGNLKKYDAIITGIRAYNTNEWMNDVYDDLLQYVENGGNLIVQYNTSNQIGPVKAKIAPYPFIISRNRVTEENAVVSFINPNEPLLQFPNKITAGDFDNWVQERSVYEATEPDLKYRSILLMNDAGEKPQNGSLIAAKYGKGNFIYCSLALFRQLPAGVPGAYKLLANMVELSKNNK